MFRNTNLSHAQMKSNTVCENDQKTGNDGYIESFVFCKLRRIIRASTYVDRAFITCLACIAKRE